MSDKPLNEYIDLEAYDVVTGEQYRALKEQLEAEKQRAKVLDGLRIEAVGKIPSEVWNELPRATRLRLTDRVVSSPAIVPNEAASELRPTPTRRQGGAGASAEGNDAETEAASPAKSPVGDRDTPISRSFAMKEGTSNQDDAPAKECRQ